uniref:Cobalamin biosynthesis protein CobD/CbiB n=1 Tax=Desertifilum tharense IPPAS B-1220 TaxID=1781255 RepID=A0ACD5GWL1_9CYAN
MSKNHPRQNLGDTPEGRRPDPLECTLRSQPRSPYYSQPFSIIWLAIRGDGTHPVQLMGWVISRYSQWVFQYCSNPRILRLAGMVLGTGLIAGSGLISWLFIQVADRWHPVLSLTIETLLLASCFAGRSLRQAAIDVLKPLTAGELEMARQKLSLYVGRDTEKLSPSEIFRALLETVSENTVDGVTAPSFCDRGRIDSRRQLPTLSDRLQSRQHPRLNGWLSRTPFTDIGWFSAKLEDALTWLPCRLTVLTLALISGKPRQVWQICQRDAPQDPSPNSGWSESAYAAILGVQLGGTNTYRGKIKTKPLLGDPINPITPETLNRAFTLTRHCFLLWLAAFLVLKGVLSVKC